MAGLGRLYSRAMTGLGSLRDDNAARRGLASLDDWSNEQLQYLLGPQGYGALSGATALAREVTPAADFRDYVDYGGRAVESARKGDAAGALGNAGWAGLATLGAVLPGSAAMVDEATDGARKGIRAYHGSPHDFDRFDMSKIGTGEGAQAYGHGLYFAEGEGTARSYRDQLAGRIDVQPVEIDGKPYSPPTEQHQRVAAIIAKDGRRNAMETLRALRDQDLLEPEQERVWTEILRETKGKDVRPVQGGHMYEVNINANPEDFLDWDKPLSEQPGGLDIVQQMDPGFRRQLEDDLDRAGYSADLSALTGRELHQLLRRAAAEGDIPYGETPLEDVAGFLRDADVPGIKYLDGMSRNAGEGSRNYVVFDESLIEILRKYGLAGLGIGLGAGGLASMPTQAEAQNANR